jgi:hypothetical protein
MTKMCPGIGPAIDTGYLARAQKAPAVARTATARLHTASQSRRTLRRRSAARTWSVRGGGAVRPLLVEVMDQSPSRRIFG